MILPAPSFPPRAGETGGARIARIMQVYAGCSLSSRRDELAALVGRGIDDESVVQWATNCATFALGVLFAAGCPFDGLKAPLKNGLEFSLLVTLGDHYGAWRIAVPSEYPPAGALMWYRIAGTNDDHVEIMLQPPDHHGGGGRAGNAISSEIGNVHVSVGRPLYKWLDPAAIGLPDAVVDTVDTVVPVDTVAAVDVVDTGAMDAMEAPTRPALEGLKSVLRPPLPFYTQSTLPPPPGPEGPGSDDPEEPRGPKGPGTT